MERKQDVTFKVVLLGLLLVALILLAVVLIILLRDGGRCVRYPLQFGLEKLGEANDANVSCWCNFDKYGIPGFTVSKDDMKMVER